MQWSHVLGMYYFVLKTHIGMRRKHSDWPCIRLTAALQQRQQDRIVLVAAVILCFIVQVGQQFNTLRRATWHWADISSDRLNTAMTDDILQFADKSTLTTGKAVWPAPKGPSTQHSSDRYLRLKESRDCLIWWCSHQGSLCRNTTELQTGWGRGSKV